VPGEENSVIQWRRALPRERGERICEGKVGGGGLRRRERLLFRFAVKAGRPMAHSLPSIESSVLILLSRRGKGS